MKNLIAVLLCLAVLSGCKKDNQSSGQTLIGKWTLKKVEFKYFNGSTLLKDSLQDSIYKAGNKYVQFNNDGTGTSNIQEAYINVNQNLAYATGIFTYTTSNTDLNFKFNTAVIPITRSISFSADGQFISHAQLSYTLVGQYGLSTVNQTIDEYFSR